MEKPMLTSMLLLFATFNFHSSCQGFSSSTSLPTRNVRPFSFVRPSSSTSSSSYLQATPKLSPLPEGISPFEKSISKKIDIQGNLRTQAKPAVEKAIQDGIHLMEIEFPPLLGGDQVGTISHSFVIHPSIVLVMEVLSHNYSCVFLLFPSHGMMDTLYILSLDIERYTRVKVNLMILIMFKNLIKTRIGL